MAAISITIPDAALPRVLDAFASQYGWTPGLGPSKAQFAKARLIDFIRDTVRRDEAGAAAQTARLAAEADVDAAITPS